MIHTRTLLHDYIGTIIKVFTWVNEVQLLEMKHLYSIFMSLNVILCKNKYRNDLYDFIKFCRQTIMQLEEHVSILICISKFLS